MQLLMWNLLFHAEHDLHPSLPFHGLTNANVLIRARLGSLQPGYVRWNRDLVRGLAARPSAISRIVPNELDCWIGTASRAGLQGD